MQRGLMRSSANAQQRSLLLFVLGCGRQEVVVEMARPPTIVWGYSALDTGVVYHYGTCL